MLAAAKTSTKPHKVDTYLGFEIRRLGDDAYVAIPAGWTEAPRPAAAPAPASPAAATSEPAPDGKAAASDVPRPPPAMPNAPGSMTPERIEKLHKEFRPGPQIPAVQDP